MAHPEPFSVPPLPAPPSPETPNTPFRGPHGVRAGWRILIFLAVIAALAFILFAGFALFARRENLQIALSQLTPLGLGITEGAIFLLSATAALVMSAIEHRHWEQYGLPARSAFSKNFWLGGCAGFLAITVSLFGIFLLHGFHLTGLAIHGSTILSATAAWAATFITVGLAEEFAFRGYLQYTLTTGMRFWPAAILTSLLFGLAHRGNPGETYSGLFSVVLFGLLFCLFLRRTGNLWWAVGFHAGWDWGQTFFYGVPDSGIVPYHNLLNSSFSGPQWLTGGSVGPEASVFTPIVLGAVAILFARLYRENRYVPWTPDLAPQVPASATPV